MIARLAELWRARSRREQWLLAIMAALLGFVLLWLLVFRPLGDMLSEARERHGRAIAGLAEVKADAEVLRRLERSGGKPLPGPVEVTTGRAASEAGFQLSRLEVQGPDRASAAIPSARPQALFGWIAAMEARHGLIVERFAATANSDRTLAADIVFRRRGE